MITFCRNIFRRRSLFQCVPTVVALSFFAKTNTLGKITFNAVSFFFRDRHTPNVVLSVGKSRVKLQAKKAKQSSKGVTLIYNENREECMCVSKKTRREEKKSPFLTRAEFFQRPSPPSKKETCKRDVVVVILFVKHGCTQKRLNKRSCTMSIGSRNLSKKLFASGDDRQRRRPAYQKLSSKH